MRTLRCRQLRSALTAYVDNEVSADERLVVEDHLRRCNACRRRVSREGAVRQLLRRWSAEARDGAPLSWLAKSEKLAQRSVGTLLRITTLSGVTAAIMFVVWARWPVDTDVPLSARGQINDSSCAGGHGHASAELRDMSGPDCVRRCVEMGAQYVFISRGVVYAIRNQDLVDLPRFAGQDVQLEGDVRQNVLTVSHLWSANRQSFEQ